MRQLAFGWPVVLMVAQECKMTPYPQSLGIGTLHDGVLIGGVVFDDFNGANVLMHVAGEGPWVTKQLLYTVFNFAFNTLNVKRITGLVSSKAKHVQKFDEHVGFWLESTLKDAHPDGDLLVYCMRRQDCRWLNMRKPNALQPLRIAA
jgi:RimJ/RimL family protein N-acetyltransferase